MTDSAQVLTTDQIAALRDLTVRRINMLFKENGGPEKVSPGRYDAVSVGKWFRQAILEEIGVASDGQSYDLQTEKARREKHEADMAAMKSAKMSGALVETAAVLSYWESALAPLRAKLLALPTRVAEIIAAPGDMERVHSLAMNEVRDCLEDLSKMTGAPGEEDGEDSESVETSPAGASSADADDWKPVGEPALLPES